MLITSTGSVRLQPGDAEGLERGEGGPAGRIVRADVDAVIAQRTGNLFVPVADDADDRGGGKGRKASMECRASGTPHTGWTHFGAWPNRVPLPAASRTSTGRSPAIAPWRPRVSGLRILSGERRIACRNVLAWSLMSTAFPSVYGSKPGFACTHRIGAKAPHDDTRLECSMSNVEYRMSRGGAFHCRPGCKLEIEGRTVTGDWFDMLHSIC